MSDKELLQAVETNFFTTPQTLPPRKNVLFSGERFFRKKNRGAKKKMNRQGGKKGGGFPV